MAIFILKLWDKIKPLTRLQGFHYPRCIKSAEEFLQILKRERVCADGYFNDFSIAFFYLENKDSSHAPVRRLIYVILKPAHDKVRRKVISRGQLGLRGRTEKTLLHYHALENIAESSPGCHEVSSSLGSFRQCVLIICTLCPDSEVHSNEYHK